MILVKIRKILFLFLLLSSLSSLPGQIPFYKYRKTNLSLGVPKNINSTKSAVIITVPNVNINGQWRVGDWEEMAYDAHRDFRTMGVDALFYLNENDLFSGNNSKVYYSEVFKDRGVKNLIFLTYSEGEYELVILPFSGIPELISANSFGFGYKNASLRKTLLTLGKEIKRADLELGNFLIPETPDFRSSVSIIETKRSGRYPGQIRRNKIAVERFEKLEVPDDLDEASTRLINSYNTRIDQINVRLDSLMKKSPYQYILIDKMSNVELIRNRYQFVLRSVQGSNESTRKSLGFELEADKEYYKSIIPIMPNGSQVKHIHKEAIVHKFYIRNNISTTIYTGIWDADTFWEDALTNFINNAYRKIQNIKR